jgi:D-sedoheptulose 7-phosphate isomerase
VNIKKYANQHIKAIEDIVKKDIVKIVGEEISEKMKNNGKILICGNGGSAADSNHIAAELVCKFEKKRRSIAAISLANNSSNLTAIGNDFGFEYIFSRQLESIGESNDILIAISTSGKSQNIINAINVALSKKILTIIITGLNADFPKNNLLKHIKVNSKNTAVIQEGYMFLLHNVVRYIEDKFS